MRGTGSTCMYHCVSGAYPYPAALVAVQCISISYRRAARAIGFSFRSANCSPASAALTLFSVTGMAVVIGTGVVLAGSAEFTLPMARRIAEEEERAARLAAEEADALNNLSLEL